MIEFEPITKIKKKQNIYKSVWKSKQELHTHQFELTFVDVNIQGNDFRQMPEDHRCLELCYSL